MLRKKVAGWAKSFGWVDMLRNPVQTPLEIILKSLFLPLFGWVSAGMADFLSDFLVDY